MERPRGRDFAVDVRARVLTNDPSLNVRLAVAGAGITLADERRSHDAIAHGELVPVLEEFSTPYPGFYLFCTPPMPARIPETTAGRASRGARPDQLTFQCRSAADTELP